MRGNRARLDRRACSSAANDRVEAAVRGGGGLASGSSPFRARRHRGRIPTKGEVGACSILANADRRFGRDARLGRDRRRASPPHGCRSRNRSLVAERARYVCDSHTRTRYAKSADNALSAAPPRAKAKRHASISSVSDPAPTHGRDRSPVATRLDLAAASATSSRHERRDRTSVLPSCGSRRCACWRPDPPRLASTTPGCRSRGEPAASTPASLLDRMWRESSTRSHTENRRARTGTRPTVSGCARRTLW
jgi:hypothetical protein